jgi:mRNA interferase MazF
MLRAGQGGLAVDSLAQAEQVRVVSKGRLMRHRGSLPEGAMTHLSNALRIALDLS